MNKVEINKIKYYSYEKLKKKKNYNLKIKK